MLNDNSTKDIAILSDKKITRMEKILSFEWLGQTFASLFWIVSVFTYGIGSIEVLALL